MSGASRRIGLLILFVSITFFCGSFYLLLFLIFSPILVTGLAADIIDIMLILLKKIYNKQMSTGYNKIIFDGCPFTVTSLLREKK